VVKCRFHTAFVAAAILLSAGVTSADWEVGQPAVYYQLPAYSGGWDVYSEWGTGPLASEGYGAADDWIATTTTSITDIHFWGSWKNDYVGETGQILIQIFSNDTSDPAFPRPDECLWSTVITEGQYTKQCVYTGATKDQSWYDPRYTDEWVLNEHKKIWQYNIPTLDNPFPQQAGEHYWIQISMDYLGCEWGWKTTESVNNNSAVFWDSYNTWGPYPYWWCHPEVEWKWTQLQTPTGYCDPRVPVDLAFVLTPEPATVMLLGLGAAVVLRKRKK
jgi:hypothetical protein